MSCPVAPGGTLFRQLPLITFEILFVYLLITRFSIGFICISGGFFAVCLLYCIYSKYKYQRLYDFIHSDDNLSDKYIPIPSNGHNKNIVVYCYKVSKPWTTVYTFASPLNFNLSANSVPFKEINGNEFINHWNDNTQIVKPYCIDPFDLSIWFININNQNKESFNIRLSSHQYNWNETCQSYNSQSPHCIMYRICKRDFIKLCTFMIKKNLIKNMKFMSSHLCLLYDTDYDNQCSTADNLGYIMKLSSTDNYLQFISNHCALTGLQFRYVQLRRSMNKMEIKKLKSELFMLFHHYFLFLYGTIVSHGNGDNVVLKMNSFDIFWDEFILIALPGVKKIFVYQSISKSVEIAYNKYSNKDPMCYFLSLFCFDDIFVGNCMPYKYFYMLQETVDKFNTFHSDFLHTGDNQNVNVHTRQQNILSGRDTVFDISCQILALFIYVQHCMKNEKIKTNGITEMRNNFYMIRYDTDLCDQGIGLISSLLSILKWNTNNTANQDKIRKLLKSTQHKNYYPKVFNQQQLKRLSFLLAQYESCSYVSNIQ